jgi:hypothetical protein
MHPVKPLLYVDPLARPLTDVFKVAARAVCSEVGPGQRITLDPFEREQTRVGVALEG